MTASLYDTKSSSYSDDDAGILVTKLQVEEWEVLQGRVPFIQPSVPPTSNGTVRLEVPVELDSEKQIEIVPILHELYNITTGPVQPALLDSAADKYEHSCSPTSTVSPISVPLSNLPPLLLDIILPPSYPTHSPAELVAARAVSGWVPPRMIEEMRRQMMEMWTDMGGDAVSGGGTGILYTWVEWIRSGEFLTSIGLAGRNGRIGIPHPSPALLLPLLLAHATGQQYKAFAQMSYPCGICLTSRKGLYCLHLGCGHVFCKACLADMWGLHVREGDVDRVGCPEVGCESNGEFREATEDEVRADPTTAHCPMEYCQEPVPRAKNNVHLRKDDESVWARLRECHSCGYSFCSFCKRTWHGPHTPCPEPVTSKIVLAYLAASENGQIRLEQHYGRASLQAYENRKWLESSTDKMSRKSMGCNHMTCSKCKTHFCYRCGHKISATNPYQHFSTPGTSCYSRLFDFVPSGEDGWQPIEASDSPVYGYLTHVSLERMSVFRSLLPHLIVAYHSCVVDSSRKSQRHRCEPQGTFQSYLRGCLVMLTYSGCYDGTASHLASQGSGVSCNVLIRVALMLAGAES
ncbi:RWD-domain-containing protein [Pisolithus sp. B1]|nr:RWD-domain-containing protein [Pisolithus sp. B1]